MTSSLERPDLVKVLMIRQELDVELRKPQDWDLWPELAQSITLDAVLRHALRDRSLILAPPFQPGGLACGSWGRMRQGHERTPRSGLSWWLADMCR